MTTKAKNASLSSTITPPASHCRLLCASAAAYGIQWNGPFTENQPYYDNVGFTEQPVVIQGKLSQTAACLIGQNQDGIVLAFRGTIFNSVLDWITDLIALPIEVPGITGKVHAGIMFSLAEILPQIVTQLNTMDLENNQLIITGHSKGGGMASLAAIELANNYSIAAEQVVTFASPCIGNQDFVTAYNKTVNQLGYINAFDIVPWLPSQILAESLELIAPAQFQGILKDIANWDYAIAGSSEFIDSSGVLKTGDDFLAAMGDLKTALENGNFDEILAAHSYTCGGGYMTAVCQDPNFCNA